MPLLLAVGYRNTVERHMVEYSQTNVVMKKLFNN
jgi:hypothetical protein